MKLVLVTILALAAVGTASAQESPSSALSSLFGILNKIGERVQPAVEDSITMLLERIRQRAQKPAASPVTELPVEAAEAVEAVESTEDFEGATRDFSKLAEKIDKLKGDKGDKNDKPPEKEIVYVPQEKIVEKPVYVYVTPAPAPAPAAPIVIHIPAQQQKPMYHPPQKRPC